MSTPSPSTTAYLFADRFVLAAQPGKTGMKAFGTGAVVVTAELAGGLVAIALWQLREMGAVTLEAYSAKKLGFISTSGVRVKLVGTADTAGVEKRCLAELEKSKKSRTDGMSAWDVANFICRDGKNPYGTVIQMAIDEAVELGCLQRVAQEVGIGGRLTGKPGTRLEAVPDRVAELKPAADELAEKWRGFRQGEAGLAKLLRSGTYEGIDVQGRRGRDDD
jgi:hypothetical protein